MVVFHLPSEDACKDYPVRSTAPDAVDQLHYDESIFVGYRHFDAQSIEPAFAFGHGLGYSTFVYGDLEVEESRRGETMRCMHRSWSPMRGRRAKEVVQLYVSKLAARVPRPEQELAALRVVYLEPGESRKGAARVGAKSLQHMGRRRALVGRVGRHIQRRRRPVEP